MSSKDLTPKQAAFAREYLVDLNATQAAIRAGYAPRSAEMTGSRLLRNDKVAAAVQKAMDARSQRTELTADKVLRDIEEVRAIAREQGELNIALKASELQGKHLKLFTDKVDVGGQEDNPLQVLLSQITGKTILPK